MFSVISVNPKYDRDYSISVISDYNSNRARVILNTIISDPRAQAELCSMRLNSAFNLRSISVKAIW